MAADRTTITATVWVKIFSALSWSPFPMEKAQRVEVPMAKRIATPERMLIKGREMFTAARARPLTPLATKMPSMMV